MFLLKLSIVLAAAAIGSYICRRLRQPAVLGQLIFGMLIGPSALNLVQPTDTFAHLSELGVIVLMFIAGLETEMQELVESGRASTAIALGGVTIPVLLGVGASMAFGMSIAEGFFIGTILAATSVSISVETLREMDKLKTKQGITILGAAVIDDVIGIILLSLAASFTKTNAQQNVLLIGVKILGFFAICFILGYLIIKLSRVFFSYIEINRTAVAGLIFCLIMSFISEEMGVAAITGAYIAGIILSETPFKERISQSAQDMSYVFLTPIFFVVTGMKVDVAHLFTHWEFGVVLLIVAIAGKLIGCGTVSRLFGFKGKDALQIGIGMVPRGEVALIVTDIGLKLNVVPKNVFTSIIFMIVATTIITPPLLKRSFEEKNKSGNITAAG